jgi:hypothetical protein
MESKENKEIVICDVCLIPKKVCSADNKYICTKCILFNKEEIKYYKANFDKITSQTTNDVSVYELLDKLNDYEGFNVLNKAYQKYLEDVDVAVESTNEKVYLAKDIMVKHVKQLLFNLYLRLTENFEKTVKAVNTSISTLDFKNETSKNEFNRIKGSLDEQTEFLDSEEKLNAEFQKIIDGSLKIFEKTTIVELMDDRFKLSISRLGHSLRFDRSKGSIVESKQKTGTTYSFSKSEESFPGEFRARFKIVKIDSSKTVIGLYAGIGIIRKNSTNYDVFYNDSIVLQSNGYISNKFTIISNHKKLFDKKWETDDEITVSRDKYDNIYFGKNEDNACLAFEKITGEFKLVVGFNSSSHEDVIELIDIE